MLRLEKYRTDAPDARVNGNGKRLGVVRKIHSRRSGDRFFERVECVFSFRCPDDLRVFIVGAS